MTDEKVSTTFPAGGFVSEPSAFVSEGRGEIVIHDGLLNRQEAEERKQAKRAYVEAMREGWRRKHGWRNR